MTYVESRANHLNDVREPVAQVLDGRIRAFW